MKPFDRFALLALLAVLVAGAGLYFGLGRDGHASVAPAAHATPKVISIAPPQPERLPIFWMDSAGNIGIRGVLAVVPGVPKAGDAKANSLSPDCWASVQKNGNDALTLCLTPAVGKPLAKELGFDTWTSEPSANP